MPSRREVQETHTRFNARHGDHQGEGSYDDLAELPVIHGSVVELDDHELDNVDERPRDVHTRYVNSGRTFASPRGHAPAWLIEKVADREFGEDIDSDTVVGSEER